MSLVVLAMVSITAVWLSCESNALDDPHLPPAGDSDTDTDTDGDTDTDSDGDTDGDSDGDGDTDTNSDNDTEICAEADFVIELEKIDILTVMDRSQSMCNQGIWDPVGEKIAEVVKELDERINFGLLFFPSLTANSVQTQCLEPQAGQTPEEIPLINFGEDNIDQKIKEAFDTHGCYGGTPTAKTLEVTEEYLKSLSGDVKRYVMLATDGAPNCNSEHDIDTDYLDSDTVEECICTNGLETCGAEVCLDDIATYDAAESMYNAGFPMFVIGYEVPAEWTEVMTNIASFGSGGQSDYYPVDNPDAFVEKLKEIIYSLVECDFDVDWDAIDDQSNNATDDPNKINFHCLTSEDEPISDDNIIGYNAGCAAGDAGWSWVDNTYEEAYFCPESCLAVKDGTCKVVRLTAGCDTIVIR